MVSHKFHRSETLATSKKLSHKAKGDPNVHMYVFMYSHNCMNILKYALDKTSLMFHYQRPF